MAFISCHSSLSSRMMPPSIETNPAFFDHPLRCSTCDRLRRVEYVLPAADGPSTKMALRPLKSSAPWLPS